MSRGRRTSALHALTAVVGAAALLFASSAVTAPAFGGAAAAHAAALAAPVAGAPAPAAKSLGWIDTRYKTDIVPSVVGASGGFAVQKLKKAGYQVWVGKPRYDAKVKKHVVVTQVLKAGSSLRKGRTVTIYTSLGPKPVYQWKRAKASTYGGPRENQRVAGPFPSTGKLEKRGILYFAHKSMKFGTKVVFAYNGRTATAICVDRGPYVGGREFDLGKNTADALRFSGVHKLSWAVAK